MKFTELTHEAKREVLRRASRLASLHEHQGFLQLEQEVEQREKRMQKVLLAHMLGDSPVDQGKVDRHKGFVQGMRYVLSLPAGAISTMEEASREDERGRAGTSRED